MELDNYMDWLLSYIYFHGVVSNKYYINDDYTNSNFSYLENFYCLIFDYMKNEYDESIIEKSDGKFKINYSAFHK